jgi:hypothetical protein
MSIADSPHNGKTRFSHWTKKGIRYQKVIQVKQHWRQLFHGMAFYTPNITLVLQIDESVFVFG